MQSYIGTSDRLKNLRALCLERDRHRCVISRKFDESEALRRWQDDQDDAKDDDNVLLKDCPTDMLEVAHILPHSLTQVDEGTELVRFSANTILPWLNFFRTLRNKLRLQFSTCLIMA